VGGTAQARGLGGPTDSTILSVEEAAYPRASPITFRRRIQRGRCLATRWEEVVVLQGRD
jgi:hypothetical protein